VTATCIEPEKANLGRRSNKVWKEKRKEIRLPYDDIPSLATMQASITIEIDMQTNSQEKDFVSHAADHATTVQFSRYTAL